MYRFPPALHYTEYSSNPVESEFKGMQKNLKKRENERKCAKITITQVSLVNPYFFIAPTISPMYSEWT